MSTKGVLSILLAGALVLVIATGVALAGQTKSDLGEDKPGDNGTKDDSNTRDDGGQALQFEGRPTSANAYVDLAQPGKSTGDDLIISDELYRTADGQGDDQGDDQGDGQNSSERIGRADGRCTLIDPSSERFMCTVITSFENGTIVTEGVVDQDSQSPSSVTGGTGEYRGVSGEATMDLAPAEGPHTFRFDLERNGDGTSQPERNDADQQETQGGTETKVGDTNSNNKDSQSTDEAEGETSVR
jgi:hypothetical protein